MNGESAMPDYRSMFDRDYIGSWDLPPGRDVTVTIARVEAGVLTSQGNRKSKKPIVHFEGKDKGFALNKTNAKAIAGMYGNDTKAWIGKRIAIYATKTQFGSETVDCIRVRPQVPRGESKQAQRSQAAEQPKTWRDVLNLHGDGITNDDINEAGDRLSAEHPERMQEIEDAREQAIIEVSNGN